MCECGGPSGLCLISEFVPYFQLGLNQHVWMCRAFGSVPNGASVPAHEAGYWRKFKTALEAAKQRRASKASLTS